MRGRASQSVCRTLIPVPWQAESTSIPKPEVDADDLDAERDPDRDELITLERVEEMALASLTRHVLRKNPYEFQDLVAALLRGMGYFTLFVAPRGKDGGIDIVAYRDPLGTETPRIKVQVKHRPDTKAPVKDLRELMGFCKRAETLGSSSRLGASPRTPRSARESRRCTSS